MNTVNCGPNLFNTPVPMSYKELRQCIERGLAEGDDVANIENWIAEATALDRTMIRTLLKQLDLQCHDITIRTSQLRHEDCNLNSERTIGYFYHANENQPRRKLRPVATSSSSNLLSPLVERNLTRAAELDKIGLKYSRSKPKKTSLCCPEPSRYLLHPQRQTCKIWRSRCWIFASQLFSLMFQYSRLLE